MKRFLVKTKFGVGLDLEILDEAEHRVAFADGKFDIRLSAEVLDAEGTLVYKLRGKVMQIRKQVALLDADDNEIATIKAKVSPIKSQMDLEAIDGTRWHLEGNLIEREYTVTSEGRAIIHINQKLKVVGDAFVMDVDESVSPTLAAAFMWAVYSFREKK